MTDINDVLASAKPKTSTVHICPRGDLLGLHEQLEETLQGAMLHDETTNSEKRAPDLARQLLEVQEQIAAAKVPFTFTSIGGLAWSDLLAKHLPSEDDREQGLAFAPTFPAAAVAASCTDPVMRPEQVEQLRERINEGQWRELWNGCLAANVDGRDPFSLAAFALVHGISSKPE